MKSNSKVYRLTGGKTPLTCMIATKHSRSKELTWLDKEKKENRALRYATNQSSIFQDEQDGQARLGHIVFIDGTLVVDNRKMTLQKFLDYHPDNVKNGGTLFYEMNHEAEAKKEVEAMDLDFEAQKLSRELSMKELESVMRYIAPDRVDKMYADEIKRDVRVFAKRYPAEFLDMFDNVEVETDNTIANIIDAKLITFRKKNSEVWYNLENNKKLLFRVPFGENHVDALTDYFHNDKEGVKKYNELVSLLEEL
jgi:hypothetical protein